MKYKEKKYIKSRQEGLKKLLIIWAPFKAAGLFSSQMFFNCVNYLLLGLLRQTETKRIRHTTRCPVYCTGWVAYKTRHKFFICMLLIFSRVSKNIYFEFVTVNRPHFFAVNSEDKVWLRFFIITKEKNMQTWRKRGQIVSLEFE
jgi:hypothetical protein